MEKELAPNKMYAYNNRLCYYWEIQQGSDAKMFLGLFRPTGGRKDFFISLGPVESARTSRPYRVIGRAGRQEGIVKGREVQVGHQIWKESGVSVNLWATGLPGAFLSLILEQDISLCSRLAGSRPEHPVPTDPLTAPTPGHVAAEHTLCSHSGWPLTSGYFWYITPSK